MKNVFRILILAAVAATFSLPALAQDTTSTSGGAAAPAQNEEAKTALYEKWRSNYNGSPDQQKVAYEAAKEYVRTYTTEDAYLNAVKKWLPKYEKAVRDFECTQALTAGNAGNSFQACRQVLAADPNNLKMILALSNVGYADAYKGNKNLTGETLAQVRRAIQLIESGTSVDSWAPYANKEATLGWLHYYHGYLTRESAPNEAAQAFIKAAQANGPTRTEATTYWYLGNIYKARDYDPLAADYNRLYAGKDATPEAEAMYARLNQVLDRVIDAYARTVALSNDPKAANFRKGLMEQLTALYKARNSESEAGLNELISGVLSKPLPMPGDATATPAASAPSTGAPAGTTGTSTGAPARTTGTSTGAATTARPAATSTPAAKPAAASTQPRPRS